MKMLSLRQLLSRIFRKSVSFVTRRSQLIHRTQFNTALLQHRLKGFELLKGTGIEIGALHQPSPVPRRCTIFYADAIPKNTAVALFPELNPETIVSVDKIVDLDTSALTGFKDCSLDFIILNHVIEHVANPIRVILDIFRVLKKGGLAVISAPDKNFTFDKTRTLTSFSHLHEDYSNSTAEVATEHYVDFLRAVHPEKLEASPDEVREAIDQVKNRREHAHVWNSSTFQEFLTLTLPLSPHSKNAELRYCSHGEENHFEFFGVYKKK